MPFTEHDHSGLLYDTADGLDCLGGVCHAFTTRRGGVSPAPFDSLNFFEQNGDRMENVRENYRLLGEAMGLPLSRAVACRQVHGNRVHTACSEDAGKLFWDERPADADALLTDVPGLPLVVFSADCCTILLYDPIRRCVGAVHAGWRGTALGIVREAVSAMVVTYGANPADVRAALGPAIGACCFETDADVPDAIRAALGEEAEPFVTETSNGKFRVDLRPINRLWLLHAGLDPRHIEIHPDCTMCHPERYWSHRRLGARRGGQIAVIALEEP